VNLLDPPQLSPAPNSSPLVESKTVKVFVINQFSRVKLDTDYISKMFDTRKYVNDNAINVREPTEDHFLIFITHVHDFSTSRTLLSIIFRFIVTTYTLLELT
jgi:hypothetical protein